MEARIEDPKQGGFSRRPRECKHRIDNQVTQVEVREGACQDLAQVSSLGAWELAVRSLRMELMRKLRFNKSNDFCLGQRLVSYEV